MRHSNNSNSDNSKRLQAIFEGAVDGIITISERGIIESLNPAAAILFGYAPSEVVGKNIHVLMPEPHHSKHDGYLDKYSKGGSKNIIGVGRELLGKRKDGSLFPFFLSVSEVILDDKKIFTGFIHDKSQQREVENELVERKKIEAELKASEIEIRNALEKLQVQSEKINEEKKLAEETLAHLKETQEQLIQAEKMASLGELIAGIAHEIQNPLNFVKNFSEISTELLEEMIEELNAGNEEDVREVVELLTDNLEKIKHHGERASSIVRGMLNHSRNNSEHKELTDINALCDEYLRLAFHGLRAKNKNFNSDYETKLDEHLPKIKIIPQEVGRVVLNLINNAFYVVHEKSKEKIVGFAPKIIVATQLNNHTEHVEIRVTDNGNGISPENMDKIFQPFFTTKPKGEGTGLGLSLSYDIITEGHQGKLSVESTVGTGTTFKIELPLDPDKKEDLEKSKRTKILVVDDEKDVRDLFLLKFRKEIKRKEIEFIFAFSGEEAFNLVKEKEHEVVLILSDINMPGMSGLDLLRAIKTQIVSPPPPKVIMITAYGDKENFNTAKELGADDFLTKPVDFKKLKEKLKTKL